MEPPVAEPTVEPDRIVMTIGVFTLPAFHGVKCNDRAMLLVEPEVPPTSGLA